MKKIITILVLALIIFLVYSGLKKSKEEKLEKDYAKIDKVKHVMAELQKENAMRTISGQDRWIIFDARLVKEKDEPFYNELEEKLGEDFNSQLSNGDYLFIGVMPHLNKFRIYAGDPQEDNSMIYPDWEYKRLKEKSN